MSEEGQGAASHAKQAGVASAPPTSSSESPLAHECESSDAITQTNNTQMTAASVPANDGKWHCEACTYENFPQSRKCTMCRTQKPVLGEDIFKLQEGASALPHPHPPSPPEPCGAEAIAERLKPLRISSPQGQGHSSNCNVAKWPCPTCTYENWPKSLKCAMCGTAPPHLPHPYPMGVRPAKQTLGINDISNNSPGENEPRRTKRTQLATAPAPDWIWLQACLGVVEGDSRSVEAYLSSGGDPARALTASEVQLLNRASAFDPGHTLVHLAIRFQRQDILSTVLSRISGGGPGLKRSPSYIAADVARCIRRRVARCVRARAGAFPCRYLDDVSTFTLPYEISELPGPIQEQLFSELLDREVQETLEAHPPLINWSVESEGLAGSRLYALWNRSAGDCLPDALWQAACGVSDRDNTLRGALRDTLQQGAAGAFYRRWAAWEVAQARRDHYAPSDAQLRAEWARLVAATHQPRQALHQLHVWVAAHVLRRPLVVYGVDVVNSFRGEPLGYAHFQGIYLPLLWEPAFCSKSPLCIGYTRGHFSALVPMDAANAAPAPRHHSPYICREQQEEDQDVTFVPLTDSDGKLLPVHFLNSEEMEDPEGVVRRWVRGAESREGWLVARRDPAPAPRPLLHAQLCEEWLNHYRRLQQQSRGPFPPRSQSAPAPPSTPAPTPAPRYRGEPDAVDE